MTIVLSENFRALFYAPFYAAHASGAFRRAGIEVELRPSSDPLEAARALMQEPDDDPNDLAALDRAWAEEQVTFGPDNVTCPKAADILKNMENPAA